MIALAAPSGTGKTTTALALARCGLQFASDDILVLRREPAGIVSWGLPRPLNVHRQTASMLPWLGLGPEWDDNGEQRVPRRNLAAMVALEDRELPVTRLALLQGGARAMVEPLDASDMLVALVADNVRGSTSGLTPIQGQRFAMLADLARTVPAYRVTIPRGLSDIESITAQLGRAPAKGH